MIWVESAGGPLAVMTEADMRLWSGGEADYTRICAIESAGVLPLESGGQALVLADEPAATAFVSHQRALVQWIYADPGTDVHSVVRESFDSATWEIDSVFDVRGPLVLFDPALPGPEVAIYETDTPDSRPTVYEATESAIRVDIPFGKYAIESADVEPNERTCFRIHRFSLIT